jgi:hypothetical protein
MGRVKNISLLCSLLTGFAVATNFCVADGRTSPEFLALNNVAFAVRLNVDTSGQTPTNWQQITQYCDVGKWNRQLSQAGKPFILQECYVFIRDQWIISPARNRRIVLARNQPKTNYEGKVGRYLVCWDGNSEQIIWMPEDDFQKALKQSGVKLPQPEPAEVRAAKEAVEKLIAREVEEREFILKNAPRPSLAKRWTVLQERIKSWFVTPKTNSVSGGQIRWESVLLGVLLVTGLAGGWYWLGQRR